MTHINVNKSTNVSFNGIWEPKANNQNNKKPSIEQIKDGGKKIMDKLGAMASSAKTMVHKTTGVHSSAPNVTNIEDTIYKEINRLSSKPIETVEHLEEKGYEPKINKEGLFVTLNVPYSGVIESEKGLVEYIDGKPVTVIINESNGSFINQRIITYEYPEGSIAAVKTEKAVLNEYNHRVGHSLAVPTSINDEVGLNIPKEE